MTAITDSAPIHEGSPAKIGADWGVSIATHRPVQVGDPVHVVSRSGKAWISYIDSGPAGRRQSGRIEVVLYRTTKTPPANASAPALPKAAPSDQPHAWQKTGRGAFTCANCGATAGNRNRPMVGCAATPPAASPKPAPQGAPHRWVKTRGQMRRCSLCGSEGSVRVPGQTPEYGCAATPPAPKATPRQVEYLRQLVARQDDGASIRISPQDVDWDTLTKSDASRMIDMLAGADD